MKYILVLVLCFVVSTAVAETRSSPMSQESCGLRSDIVKLLREKHEEEQVAIGLENNNRLIEVFVSPRGSFTVLLSYPIGYSCVATMGNNWETDSFTPRSKGKSL
tara:strand:+ start:13 stop:327 length:315 start_codon:yes stop_codon:yes gene_type:complete